MIKFILLLALGISPLFSQVLPTIPKNVFRFTNGYIHNNGSWNLSNQNFNLRGLARRYFDNKIYDENGNFNSNYDLYYLGSTSLDTNNTFSLNYLGNDIPNHLSLIGQTRAKNLVLSYINKKG